MKAEVLKGHLDGLLLAALEAGPAHGYRVIQTLREGSGGRIDLPTGTVYPVLHRLERAGLIAGDWSTAEGRPRRIYQLTAAGRRELDSERTAWREFAGTISALLEGKAAPWPTPAPATA